MAEFEFTPEALREAKATKGDFGYYTGGGYELKLRGNIEELKGRLQTLQTNNWIDNRTRALITEFSVYNAQVNMFGVVKIVAELIGGGVLPYYRVDVISLTRTFDFVGYVTMACEVAFCLSTFYYIINSLGVLKELGAKEFFKQAWNVVDVFTIFLSLLAIGLQLLKQYEVLKLTKKIGLTKGNAYLSIDQAQTVANLYDLTVAMTVFTSLLKLCRLLRLV